ncbi:RHS repeat domain-containing protein [Vibrio coralliilyticus]|uniref:RHS repeat protein n=1 Tax=Vibrio coralliilyticus TaxID=190893 RepID=UPI001E31AFB5|nr:RHS repeat protein [Vibrio coralliilyticus]MCC2525569.1 RHS repeat protein [Vibrio coralliilyticus]
MSDIVSNSFNFEEFINSGVDPRTGSYSISFTLGELLSNKLCGPNFQLIISHNSLNYNDEGFGIGWSLSMSEFDKVNRRLTLSSGKSFETILSNNSNELFMPNRKTKDVRAYLIDNDSIIKIVYKSGNIDYIDYNSGKIIRTASKLGHEIFFHYAYFQGHYSLCRVNDGYGHSISIDHWSYDYYSIISSENLDSGYSRSYLVSKISRGYGMLLDSVSMVNNSQLNTNIIYEYNDELNNYIIKQINHYSGLVEIIDYDYKGHLLPEGSEGIKSVPYVSTHTLVPGFNQPHIVSEYEYSLNNYLGRGINVKWESGIDILFKAESDYKYSSRERVGPSLCIERTYNKYHLLESETYTRDDIVYKKVVIEYFADLNKSIEEQPNNYCFKKKELTTYYNDGKQRSESFTYDFDDYGNCIFEIAQDGTETTLEYYPSEGENDNCPPHPYGFVCYLKNIETKPVSTEYNEQSVWKHYRYDLIMSLNDTVCIVESEILTSYGERTENTYFTDQSIPASCGLISTISVSLQGNHCGSMYFEYELVDHKRTSYVTMQGFDGKSATREETQDIYSGNLISKIDHEGLETRYTYNENGQYTAIEVAPETNRYSIKRFDYDYTQSNNSLLITGSKGHKQKFVYDGMGREIYHLSEDESGTLRTISEINYDAESRVSSSIERDWYDNNSVEYVTQYNYNIFGEIDYTTMPNGNILLSKFDPVTLTTTTGVLGLSYDVVQYDINGKPVEELRFTPDGQLYSSSQRSYDSFGQTVKATDPLGNSSYYYYDSLGRNVKVKDPNNSTKDIKYALNSTDPLITEICVSGTVVGNRVYDGLQRIISDTQVGRETYYSYSDSQASPSELILPQNIIWSFDYDPLLKKNIRAFTNLIELNFGYDSTTGKLVSSENENSINNYEYDHQGRLIRETRVVNNVSYESTYSYSILGVLLSYQDYLGNVELYRYDQNKNLIEIKKISQEKTYITNFEYDKYNRLITQCCYELGEELTNRVEHHIYWDHFTRETNRIITKSGAILFSMSTEFDFSDRILSREKSKDGVILQREEFSYDAKSRLLNYSTSGLQIPKDINGFEIVSQTFTYDYLDNISTVRSIFNDKSENIESYHYDNLSDPTQLTRIGNSHPDLDEININYDGLGNIVLDEQNRSYVYDDDQNLILVKDALGEMISSYSYNAEGQLISKREGDDIISYLYRGDQLINEVSLEESSSYLRYFNKPILRLYKNNSSIINQFLATDKNGSIISEISFGEYDDKEFIYLPFGYKNTN